MNCMCSRPHVCLGLPPPSCPVPSPISGSRGIELSVPARVVGLSDVVEKGKVTRRRRSRRSPISINRRRIFSLGLSSSSSSPGRVRRAGRSSFLFALHHEGVRLTPGGPPPPRPGPSSPSSVVSVTRSMAHVLATMFTPWWSCDEFDGVRPLKPPLTPGVRVLRRVQAVPLPQQRSSRG